VPYTAEIGTWLQTQIDKVKNEPASSELNLPKKENDQECNLSELNNQQRRIAQVILHTIVAWMNKSSDYKPLRMTVSAGAGRGKSFLIHQLTSAIKRMLHRNDVVLTTAFTGSAANNIGGRTCHSAFGISTINPDLELSPAAKARMLHDLRHIVAIFIDERSQLSSELLGAAERNTAYTYHGGGESHLNWGCIPVVIMLGDDYQLPPVNINGKGKGAFYVLDD